MRTFSSTVRCGNTAEIWNERTMPRRATSAGAVAVMSWPLKRIVPARGRQELGQQVEEGGLAGAVGADQGVDGAAPDLEVDVVHGHEALEFLREAARFQDGVAGHCGSREWRRRSVFSRLGAQGKSLANATPARDAWARRRTKKPSKKSGFRPGVSGFPDTPAPPAQGEQSRDGLRAAPREK